GFGRFGGFGGFGNAANTAGNGANASNNTGNASSGTGAQATGTVTAVSSVADASSGVAKYDVTVAFDADANDFYVGATVNGVITTQARPNVLQVASRAITTANGVSTVVVATDGTLDGQTQTRTVETGATVD